MSGRLIRSRSSVSRRKEYMVKFYSLADDHYVCKTKEDDLMTLRQAEKVAMSMALDGLYGVPTKVGE